MEETVSVGEEISKVSEELATSTRSLLHVDELKDYLTWHNVIRAGIILLSMVAFYVVYRLIKRHVLRRAAKKMEAHTAVMLNKAISYVFYAAVAMYLLGLFGINLSAVWGAAGVAGLALGFAAQTSVSNLISGVFVLLERSLKIGDYITVDGVSGNVDNIGLLSITIHTLDNQMVRIPNSTIINTNLTNFSHFPIRRMVFDLPLAYGEDLEEAMQVALTVPAQCPCVLPEPAPFAYYDSLGAAVNLKLAVWIKGSDFILCKNEVHVQAAKAFRAAGITLRPARYDVSVLEDGAAGTARAGKAAGRKGSRARLNPAAKTADTERKEL